ncbi:MAG: hypothetical protein LUC95_02545 [Lachnospiraceae bacterium]|nr:hypothetical protein [Lachnospiraceae bacterium]
MTEKKKRINQSGQLLWLILLVFYSLIMYRLFYRQCVQYGGGYVSDMEPYIMVIKGLEQPFSYPYPLMFSLARALSFFFTAERAMAFVLTFLNTLSVWITGQYLLRFIREELNTRQREMTLWWYLPACALTLSLYFVSMLYLPYSVSTVAGLSRCVGTYTPNPFWNATYLATRPFSVISFFEGAKLLEKYECGAKLKEYLIFAASLLLGALAKPSFTLVAIAVYAVVLLYRFVKSRGRNLLKSLYFGFCVLPAGFVMIYQFFGVFSGSDYVGESAGIGISPGEIWSLYSSNILLSVLLGNAFALFMLIYNRRKLKSVSWFRHAWQLWLAGFLMFFFLYEKGFRASHGNFAWGYMHGMFFVFLAGLMLLICNTLNAKKKKEICCVCAGWLLYAAHLACGVHFFLYLLAGYDPFI